MTITRLHLNSTSALARIALASGSLFFLASPSAAQSTSGQAGYGWPLKPFHTQHPIRGKFGDPRIGLSRVGVERSFHFRVDIAAPDGTAVYATITGRVRVPHAGHDVVSISGPNGRVFSYWHVVPAVATGTQATAYATLIGHVAAGWGHVHFAELRRGTALNPLRPGGLTPYRDSAPPVIVGVGVPRAGLAVAPRHVRGRIDLVVQAYDAPSRLLPLDWREARFAPTFVRWCLVAPAGTRACSTAVDFRRTLPRNDAYPGIYAYHTHQNRPQRRGHYLIYLVRNWDPTRAAPGRYRLDLAVSDEQGNTARASMAFAWPRERRGSVHPDEQGVSAG
jgi:hypothetical protein